MNGSDINNTRWKNLKVRLGFNGIGCCGASWSPRTPTSTMTIIENPIGASDDDEQDHMVISGFGQVPMRRSSGSGAMNTPSGMNLAMALAAERNLRVRNVGPRVAGPAKTLMRLIEETEGVHWGNGMEGRSDSVCCVCMERNKGAAFIPCGHTYCRICSRELRAKRKTCPICNRSILEILDIF